MSTGHSTRGIFTDFIADDRVFNAGATDGCGASPFRVDGKPHHGGLECAREVAMRKIGAWVETVRMASEGLGMWWVGGEGFRGCVCGMDCTFERFPKAKSLPLQRTTQVFGCDLLNYTTLFRHEPIPIWLFVGHRPFHTLLFPSPSPHQRLAHLLSFPE